jgi:hypothetical protein
MTTIDRRLERLRAKAIAERAEKAAEADTAAADTHTAKPRSKRRRRRSVAKIADAAEFRYRAKSLASALRGFESLNPAQKWLCRAAAQLSLELEAMEGERAAGEEIDLREYGMLTDRLGRLTERLGLQPGSQRPAVEFAFTALASEPYEPEPVDVTPAAPELIEQLPAPERVPPPPEQAPPRQLTSAEKMVRHDAERAAWLEREYEKASRRPPSPWRSESEINGGLGRAPIIHEWSNRRRYY